MRVAVLGLGAMGSRMAARLVRANHQVSVYNRSREAAEHLVATGAVAGDSPRAAVGDCDIVIAMVRDDDASRAIWCDQVNGALRGLRPGVIAIESSTLSPGWVKELATRVRQTGASFLDAPVVGSRPQAEAGQLIHLVGGDAEAFNRARDVLAALGSAAHHVGTAGAGATLKLAVNALFGIQVAAAAGLLAMLNRSDCCVATAIEVLSSLPVTSPATKGAIALMRAKADAPLFPIDLVEKDFAYALDQSRTDLPVTAAVHACFAKAKERGFAALNITAIARLFERA